MQTRATIPDLVKGMENHHRNTTRFWNAYKRLVLKDQAPSLAFELCDELLRKHDRAVRMVAQTAAGCDTIQSKQSVD